MYEKFEKVSGRAIHRTDSSLAPWHLIEGADRRYRELTTGRILLESLQQRLQQEGAVTVRSATSATSPSKPSKGEGGSILSHVDLGQRLTDQEYKKELAKYQGKLSRLSWAANNKKVSSVLVFEGWDAAGKGSAIRRVTQGIDPRLYRVIPIAAPTGEERAHHYLWRFWRQVPAAGMMTIFDRSWYGRVLVERVEGLARKEEWKRAFKEINDFEEQLTEHSVVISKFWIHISKSEQLRRFKERQRIAFKNYKITDDDWRNRDKWEAYQCSVNDMLERTSTEFAPWTLVAGDDKKFARIQILKRICGNLERGL